MLTRIAALSCVIAGNMLASVAHGGDESDHWTPELALQVKRVDNVRVSANGSRVLYEVSRAVMEESKSEWVTHIHIADSDGSSAFQLTRGDDSCGTSEWSPDGEWIAFISKRGVEKPNLWRIRVRGGEAERLTNEKGGVSSFEWSPDGSQIAFVMTDPESNDEEKEKKEKRDARVVDDRLKFARLYLIPAESDESGQRPVRKLLDDDLHVMSGFERSSFDWSPDGTAIAFSHVPVPKFDKWPMADISIVDVRSGAVRSLMASAAAEAGPSYSPDGRWIAFACSNDPASWARMSRVNLIPAQGGDRLELAATFDEQPQIIGWSADGQRILASETYRSASRLYALPIDGSDAETLSPDNLLITAPAMNRSRTFLGFSSETPARAPEAYVTGLDRFSPRCVSDVQTLSNLQVVKTEIIVWNSHDGLEVEGLLTYPTTYQVGARVPLLVIIHGGPTGVFQQQFIASRGAYPIAAFASMGFAVLRCNPRGSSGYGREFRFANYSDWGGGDFQDVMTGVDAVIKMGLADPDRLGIMGWSYGGYMTAWAITQTNRFRAASVGAGVTNLVSYSGTTDIPGFLPDYFHGEFWEVFKNYCDHSAMFHVAGVRTPTLIQHGENDRRVPISQGYELYNALKRQGVPVTMVVYPRQEHAIREPKLQLDAMQRNLDWFTKWLMPDD